MIETFRAMLQQSRKQEKEERRQEREEADKRNRKNETPEGRKKEEFSRQADDVKTFVQEDTTAKFVLLQGELNKQVDRISEIEKSVSTMKTSMSSLEAVSYTHLDVYKRQ